MVSMGAIITDMIKDEVLHTTKKGTDYLFVKQKSDHSLVYAVKLNKKTLPIKTIEAAEMDYYCGSEINRDWYKEYNESELISRPCNVAVLKDLIRRLKDRESI